MSSGATPASPAGLRSRDGREHPRAPLRKALEVGGVVERRRELGTMHPAVPEVAVVDAVQPQVERLDPRRPPRGVESTLVVVAEVDDRAHAVRQQRRPAGGAEPVDVIGADDRAPARLAAA